MLRNDGRERLTVARNHIPDQRSIREFGESDDFSVPESHQIEKVAPPRFARRFETNQGTRMHRGAICIGQFAHDLTLGKFKILDKTAGRFA